MRFIIGSGNGISTIWCWTITDSIPDFTLLESKEIFFYLDVKYRDSKKKIKII